MHRSTAFASLALLGVLATTSVRAQAPVDLAAVPTQAGNVVGGGGASMSGGAGDRTITYSTSGAGGGARYEQPGRIGIFGGNNGGSPYWIYATPAPSGVGREARLLNGGDDAQVVYTAPMDHRRR